MRHVLVSATIWLVATASAAQKPVTPIEKIAVADAVAPSLVRVEYTLQYDKGEAPQSGGLVEKCPNCGNYHWSDTEEHVSEERPLEVAGFVVSPTQVISPDLMIHPRFIKEIVVRCGDQTAGAKIVAWGKMQSGVLIATDQPLANARPLAIDAEKKQPYLAVSYQQLNGVWTVNVEPLSSVVAVTEDGRRFRSMPSNCLITDRTGTPVGLSTREELPMEATWKGSPLQWEMIRADSMSEILADLEKSADAGLIRVALSFRSPKKKSVIDRWNSYGDDDEDDATQRDVLGIVVDEKQVVVLANLKPAVTARLERILIHPAQGDPIAARFAHTLQDYGAFVAELEKPLAGVPSLSSRSILDFRTGLVLAADIILQGEKRVDHFQHSRIAGFEMGWKRQIHPQLMGDTSNTFLYDLNGNLVAVPIARRKKVTVQERWDYSELLPTPVVYLNEALTHLADRSDPNNVPLSEEEENRIAWLGVELQALDKELARANNVSDLTNDGQTGALVTYVYPDSPAAVAKIEPGVVLLRLHIEGHPKPLDVTVEEHGFGMETFPWDQLDELPEQYFDQLPRPWPSAESVLNRSLTELGFGTEYQLELVDGGANRMVDLQVVKSPKHYDSAPSHKSEPLGLTVRDLTYEVRRYFQKTDEDPGVIVSKIEPGSKVSIAGVKPHEIITAVNDAPVKTVADFRKLVDGKDNLRLSVTRMTRSRIVKIKMDRPADEDAGNPPTTDDGAEAGETQTAE